MLCPFPSFVADRQIQALQFNYHICRLALVLQRLQHSLFSICIQSSEDVRLASHFSCGKHFSWPKWKQCALFELTGTRTRKTSYDGTPHVTVTIAISTREAGLCAERVVWLQCSAHYDFVYATLRAYAHCTNYAQSQHSTKRQRKCSAL